MELEGLLKRHYTTVAFFQGTMMNAVDLERVKVPQLILHVLRNFHLLQLNTELHFKMRVGKIIIKLYGQSILESCTHLNIVGWAQSNF